MEDCSWEINVKIKTTKNWIKMIQGWIVVSARFTYSYWCQLSGLSYTHSGNNRGSGRKSDSHHFWSVVHIRGCSKRYGLHIVVYQITLTKDPGQISDVTVELGCVLSHCTTSCVYIFGEMTDQINLRFFVEWVFFYEDASHLINACSQMLLSQAWDLLNDFWFSSFFKA